MIDTDVLIADPLTKLMESTKLSEAIETNWLDRHKSTDRFGDKEESKAVAETTTSFGVQYWR